MLIVMPHNGLSLSHEALGKIVEFCPIESVKTIFGKICQILANLGSLKCDPYVKHLFLWLFIELQHKLCKRCLNSRDKMLKSAKYGVRPAILEKRLCLNCILIHEKAALYTLVIPQLS